MTNIDVRAAEMPRDLAIVQKLCWEYREFLATYNDDMRRTVEVFYPEADYQVLMRDLPAKHARPHGVIMLLEQDAEAVGCGMTQPLSERDAEVKRVFIRAEARGKGAGRKLSEALIVQARADGYKRLLLDTSVHFREAQKLYEKLGFTRRGPYSDLPPNSEHQLVFYELIL